LLPEEREFLDFLLKPSGLTFDEFKVFLGCFLVGSSRVDLQACKLEYSIVSPK